MTDTTKLLDRIRQSGLRKGYIAAQMGLSHAALARKINNKNDFKASEIEALCSLLGIETLEEKEALFFAQ